MALPARGKCCAPPCGGRGNCPQTVGPKPLVVPYRAGAIRGFGARREGDVSYVAGLDLGSVRFNVWESPGQQLMVESDQDSKRRHKSRPEPQKISKIRGSGCNQPHPGAKPHALPKRSEVLPAGRGGQNCRLREGRRGLPERPGRPKRPTEQPYAGVHLPPSGCCRRGG